MSRTARRRSGGSRSSTDVRGRSAAGAPATDAAATVAVRVKPGASRARVGGRYDGPHGPAGVGAVTAPAVDGTATEAARRALAELRSGAASRDKLFTVMADPAEVESRVRRLRDGAAS